MSFSPFSQHEISVLNELILGHLRYFVTDVPPQPNFPFEMIKKRRVERMLNPLLKQENKIKISLFPFYLF
jgi:hypothetical protein